MEGKEGRDGREGRGDGAFCGDGAASETDLLARMKRSWRMAERSFTSNVPVIGPLIVLIRRWVNRIAVRWYVPMLLEHQHRFNKQVVELAEIQARQGDLICDRGLSVAALAEEVARLTMRVAELEERSEGRDGREGHAG